VPVESPAGASARLIVPASRSANGEVYNWAFGIKHRCNLETTLSLDSIVVATKDQVSCRLDEESAILNMRNSVYYGTDAEGTRVWDLLRQPRTVREIRDAILNEYEVEADRCERDLLELLEKMRSEGLLEAGSEIA